MIPITATPHLNFTAEIPRLGREAIAITQNCYAPYSQFLVGAALLARSGATYLGVNIENVAYSPTLCAERAALAAAITQGERDFVGLVIASIGAVAPCGVCRQMLSEFNPKLPIALITLTGKVRLVTSLQQLLPEAFLQFQTTTRAGDE